jgi:hypothetical protein
MQISFLFLRTSFLQKKDKKALNVVFNRPTARTSLFPLFPLHRGRYF